MISKDSLQNVVNKVTSASSKAEQLGHNISEGFKSIFAGVVAGAKSFFTKR